MSVVPPEIRESVYLRDGYRCVAPKLDPDAGPCRDFWGNVIDPHRSMTHAELTYEHVTPGGGRMGRRADHAVEQGVAMCWGHHLGHGVTGQGGSIWALKNKSLTRRYLQEMHP